MSQPPGADVDVDVESAGRIELRVRDEDTAEVLATFRDSAVAVPDLQDRLVLGEADSPGDDAAFDETTYIVTDRRYTLVNVGEDVASVVDLYVLAVGEYLEREE